MNDETKNKTKSEKILVEAINTKQINKDKINDLINKDFDKNSCYQGP